MGHIFNKAQKTLSLTPPLVSFTVEIVMLIANQVNSFLVMLMNIKAVSWDIYCIRGMCHWDRAHFRLCSTLLSYSSCITCFLVMPK